MRTLEDELRALYPLDWQPSSMRPYGFRVFISEMARRGLVTVQGARVGAALVVKVEVASASLRHYLVCSSDSKDAELVTSGPDLADELQLAAQIDAGFRAALVGPSKQDPARMRAVLERCMKVLQEVQWAATEHDQYGHPEHGKCPVCESGDFGTGVHIAGCELAACIRDGNELLEVSLCQSSQCRESAPCS